MISLHQSGIKNVVASSGTALTEEQVRLIKRYTQNITVLYDGDTAGLNAAIRGTDILLEQDINVKVIQLPEGEDPDSYVSSIGGEAFENYLVDNAKDFITFRAALYMESAAKDPFKKAELVHEVVESIAKITDPIRRSIYFKECSSLLEIDEQVIITEYNKIQNKKRREKAKKDEAEIIDELSTVEEFQKPQEVKQSDNVSTLKLIEVEIIRLLLKYWNLAITETQNFAQYIAEELSDIDFKGEQNKSIYDKVINIIKSGDELPNQVLDLFEGEEKQFIVDLLIEKYYTSENWWERYRINVPQKDHNLAASAINLILKLKLKHVQILIKENQAKLKEANEEQLEDLLRVSMALDEMKGKLAKELKIDLLQ